MGKISQHMPPQLAHMLGDTKETSTQRSSDQRLGVVVSHLQQAPRPRSPEIFLGGTCGESKWRQEQCIPMLVAARLSYYNPQLGPGEWTPELIPIEAAAKAGAVCQLFVITGDSRGIASMIEAAEMIVRGVAMVLCLEPYSLDQPDSQDVNRGRKYLLDVAGRHGCAVHDSVTAATAEAIERVRSRRESQAQAAAHRQPLDQEAQDRGMPSLTRAHSWNFQQPMAPLCRQQSIHGTPEIFLGGTCGESKWRQEQCIPMLVAARLSYYNPQLGPGEWAPELIPIEAAAKAGAVCQLFVITGESRGIASMIEAAEMIVRGVAMVLCLEPYSLDQPDSQDVNRGRKYLLDVAGRHGCAVHDSVTAATAEVVQRMRALPLALE